MIEMMPGGQTFRIIQTVSLKARLIDRKRLENTLDNYLLLSVC